MTRNPLIDSLRALPPDERKRRLDALSSKQLLALRYDWEGSWARENQQRPPGNWSIWICQAGRGWGKTRVGAQFVIDCARVPGVRIALAGRTAADVRDVVVEGDSGILRCSPPWNQPHYEPSKRRITWPNGSMATTFSAAEPDQARGPQHHFAWLDELAAWGAGARALFDNLMMGLRLGERPQTCITTTPRPIALLRDLVGRKSSHVTRGSTYDNLANLSPAFREHVLAQYEGTTLGRQELYAELLDEIPGALWMRKSIDSTRVPEASGLIRTVVAVDPAVTAGDHSDETGICVCGLDNQRHAYVLADESGTYSPSAWAEKAADLFKRFNADRVVAETNQGGDMVEATLRQVAPDIPYRGIHASKGKKARAEPIAALWEQGRAHMVGLHPELEDQLVSFVPGVSGKSPDRLDAMVHGLTELVSRSHVSMSGGFDKGPSQVSRWAL